MKGSIDGYVCFGQNNKRKRERERDNIYGLRAYSYISIYII